MYEPREDSFLLLSYLKQLKLNGLKVLDLGTGSALLARAAAKSARLVLAADIDKELIKRLKKKSKNKKIQFVCSDLFSAVKDKFDLILFNPPYLPSKQIKDSTIDGGKGGVEIIERFLKQAKKHLKRNGRILLVCSSLNKGIERLFQSYGYSHKLLDQEAFFFERIKLYELSLPSYLTAMKQSLKLKKR